MGFIVYILWSDSIGKFYVGSTNNLELRVNQHNTGQGNFTKKGMPWRLVWNMDCKVRKEAVQLENKIKKRGIRRFLDDNKIEFGK